METKKNKKYDLEHRRPMFFGVGMIISLSLSLVAFEWKSEIDPIVIPLEPDIDIWHVPIDIEITRHPEPKPPKPIKQEKKIISPASILKESTEELDDPVENQIIDQEEEIVDISVQDFGTIETPVEEPFLFVEEMPSFPGGDQALLSYIAKNLKYPRAAQRIGVEGRVTMQFVIDIDGSITKVKLIQGIGAGCDEEAIRVLRSLPKFSPGKQRGQPVKVLMQVPINFQLQ